MELFAKTKKLEKQIALFLTNIIQSGLLFDKALSCYFDKGVSHAFLDLRTKVSALEAENDSIRRGVENQLYAHLLLPDMRSDILNLIEGCDKIINKYETDLILISVEQPKIPAPLKKDLSKMIKTNIDCVSALITGIQSALRGEKVFDAIQSVSALEHQVDMQAIFLKEKIFQKSKLPLARQLQLKEFVYGIEKISDMAEDMADTLSIFVVKHAV